ncbi:RagB/SusD family nutrient uptake outer membrane protein [Christiangramia forsetii]|uniref:SusD/RagB family protein n=2 Tax=Christiangramia forsetii TaxID=411153 RepID=A0M237_CHRFK|nr:RagB/SusD family nutrient uptake outer membrane protein [Christiangramia forsetii]GGG40187.1 membrane protein [Christiangramia forsetii]CAL66682.1 SusD/RagB family protein [Christiangramia forsetii KT0803]
METVKFKGVWMILIGIISLTSCSDDYLDENPKTFVSPDALLTDEEGAEIYLVGAYDAVQDIIVTDDADGWLNHWGTLAADEVVVPGWGGDRKLIFLHQLTPSNATVRRMWESMYISLNRINSVVDRVGAMTPDQIEDEPKQRILAEARYLRAMINFALVSTWENVPLIEHETTSLNNLEVPQATPEEVYAFIIEDLQAAKTTLPMEQGGGRATKGAAQALLGKVYLQMTGFPLNQDDKFALAEAELKEVIDSGVYGLVDSYPDLFDYTNEQNKEILFSIGKEGPGKNEGSYLGAFYGPNGNVNEGGGFGTVYANHEWEASYDRDDIRLLNNVAKHNANNWTPEEGMFNPESWGTNKVPWRAWKWHAEKPNNYVNDAPFDNPYIRFADVLLMYAEALNGQGELSQAVIDMTVNSLRERVRLEPTAVPDMALGSQSENAAEILAERRRELALEGWRRNDLIRFGVYEETINAINQEGFSTAGNPGPNYNEFEIRWPIPNSEIELNPSLEQNPGY